MSGSGTYFRSEFLTTNYIIVPTLNCFDKLQRCLESCQKQSIPTYTWIMNNGSDMNQLATFMSKVRVTDTNWSVSSHYPPFRSVAAAWNYGLSHLFRHLEAKQVLVINNDVYLQPETYSRLLHHMAEYHRGFVTGISVDDPNPQMGDDTETPHPDFSCFLISRDCYYKVGPFDEHFIPAYREDQDYHWRMQKLGIEAVKIDVPFFHDRSATVRENPQVAKEVTEWDDFRKEYYVEKWGDLWPSEVHAIPFNGKGHSCKHCSSSTLGLKS